MKIDNLAFILYSHSSLKWIWNVFIKEVEKYFPIDCSKYFFGDIEQNIDSKYQSILYDNSKSYGERLLTCLSQVKEDYILIHHEDMIFYDDVDLDYFQYYFEVLKNNPEFSYIKLLTGGVSGKFPEKFAEGIYKLQDDEVYKFAVQPAIWKKKDLIEILENCLQNNIYQMEDNASKFMTEKGYKCLFAWNYGDDKKRGMYHWDNLKYPFMSTALVKGNWNSLEYDIEIENLKLEYNI